MKKLFSLLIACLLLCGTAMAAETLPAPLDDAAVQIPADTVLPPEAGEGSMPAEEPAAEIPAAEVPAVPSEEATTDSVGTGESIPEAAEPSLYAFQRIYSYTGQFSDLTEGSTFYSNISALFEYGLSVGQKDGTYGAKSPATVGQGIIFAARIRSLYDNGDAEAGAAPFRTEGQHTYEAYLLYLQSLGILENELEGLYFTQATRAVMAHILARALPESFFPAINHDLVTQGYATRRYITDVTEYTPYYQDILQLYRWGICQGVNAEGAFLPDDTITRGALAAMLTRMVDPALRITLTWDVDSAIGTTWSSLVTGDARQIAAPETEADFDAAFRRMLSQEQLTLELNYNHSIDADFVSGVLRQCLNSSAKFSEHMLNHASATYYPQTGFITVTFSVLGSTPEETAAYRAETLAAAIEVHDFLWDSGMLTHSMTQKEMAKVCYTWICQRASYDYSAEDASPSHTAWSLFTEGTAVCDGYTGAYNLLLKLLGIDCYTLVTADHAWTVAILDGTEVHIDVTWGDQQGSLSANYLYFAMTPALSYGFHPW